MSLARRIAKNAALLSISNVISHLVYLALIIAVTRFLGDAGFGRFSFAVSFSSVFLFVADMGLSILTTREVSRKPSAAPRYLGAVLLLKIFISASTFLIIFALSLVLDKPLETKVSIWLLGIYLILRNYRAVFVSIFRAFEKMEYEAVAILLDRTLVTLAGILLLYSGRGIIALSASFILSGSVVLLYLWRSVRVNKIRPVFRFDFVFWKKLLKGSWPLALSNSFSLLYSQLGIILIGLWWSDSAVGWYNAALQLSSSLVFIPQMFSLAVFPSFSSFYVSSRKTLKRLLFLSLKFMAVLSIPIAVATTVLGDLILSIIYSSDFLNGLTPLRILTWTLIFNFLNVVLMNFLNATDRQKFVLYTSGAAMIVNLVASLILIPSVGYVGAAIALFLSSFFGFASYSVYIFRNFFHINYFKIFAGPFLSSVLMGVFLLFFRNLSLFFLIPFGAVSYFIFLVVLGGVGNDEMMLLKEVFSGRLPLKRIKS